jgi:hypothetical protein
MARGTHDFACTNTLNANKQVVISYLVQCGEDVIESFGK